MLKKKVNQYIVEKKLFGRGDKVLVALSGGADSVALLRILLEEGYACVCAHCNFHLRGEESDRDERFVRGLCEKLHVPLHVTHFDTAGYASRHKVSVEMAARELRYGWFEEVRRGTGSKVIAVAHHRDDSVETVLLNLIRGTGINGLRGIAPVNGAVVRPLLEASRAEIVDFLDGIGQDYVTDSTNLEDAFTRNKLRLQIIPLLQEINPSVCDAINETAHRLADVEKIYRKAVREACLQVAEGEGRFSIPRLLAEVSPQAVLFELFHPLGFNAAQLDDIFRSLSSGSGKWFRAGRYVLLRDRECLLLREDARPSAGEGKVLHQEILAVDAGYQVPRDREKAYLDADKVGAPLMLRRWQPGDSFVPFGMTGRKKVRDYLRDRKFSRFDKEEQLVACAGEDIVWLVNERADDRFRVTARTRRVLVLWVGAGGISEKQGGE